MLILKMVHRLDILLWKECIRFIIMEAGQVILIRLDSYEKFPSKAYFRGEFYNIKDFYNDIVCKKSTSKFTIAL